MGIALDAFREREGEGQIDLAPSMMERIMHKKPTNPSKENYITLDEWISVSKFKYENPFDVFDNEAAGTYIILTDISAK